jgi:hypothetical protein
LRANSCERTVIRSAIAFARARRSGGSETPVSSNASTRSFLNWACAGDSGVTALTRANSASFWKISTWKVERLRMASSAASRTLLSGWTLFRIAIGPSMFSSAIAIRSHSSSTLAGVASPSGSAANASNPARPSANICRQAADRVVASRIGSVTRRGPASGITHLLP